MWAATVEVGGYEWLVVGETEESVHMALLREYRKFCHNNKPMHPDCPRQHCVWQEFNDYWGPRVQEVELGRVYWP
jgi:hypothetical protein